MLAAIGFASLLALTACRYRAPETIVIGAAVPLTGARGSEGEYARNGVALAVAEINAAGGAGGKALRVIYEDTQSTSEGGVPAYQKLTVSDHVVATLAHMNPIVVPVASLANRTTSVLINCGGQDPRIRREGGGFVFNLVPDAILEAEAMAEDAVTRLHIKVAATFYLENDSGEAAAAAFGKAFTKLGGRIVANEQVDKNKDLSDASIARLRAASPEAVFFVTPSRTTVTMFRAAHDAGWRPQWLTDSSFELDDVIRASGALAEGVVYTSLRPFLPVTARAQQFAAAYKARNGFDPELVAATYYDGVYALKGAVDAVHGSSGADIAKGLRMVAFEGVTGRIDFTQSTFVPKPVELRTVDHGRVRVFVERSK